MRASRNQERSSGMPSLRAGWSAPVSPPPAMTCNSLLIAAGAPPRRMLHELNSAAGDNPVESGPQFLCASRKASAERLCQKSAKGRKRPAGTTGAAIAVAKNMAVAGIVCDSTRGVCDSTRGAVWRDGCRPGTAGAESQSGALPIPVRRRCHEGVQSTSLSVMFETVSSTPPQPSAVNPI